MAEILHSISNYYYTSKGEIYEKETVREDGSIRKARKVKNLPYSLKIAIKEEYSKRQQWEQENCQKIDFKSSITKDETPKKSNVIIEAVEDWDDAKSPILVGTKKFYGQRQQALHYGLRKIQPHWLRDFFFTPRRLRKISEKEEEKDSIDTYGIYWDYQSTYLDDEDTEEEIVVVDEVKEEVHAKIEKIDESVSITNNFDLSIHITDITEKVESMDSGFSSLSETSDSSFTNDEFGSNKSLDSNSNDCNENVDEYAVCSKYLANKNANCWSDIDNAINVLSWSFENILVLK